MCNLIIWRENDFDIISFFSFIKRMDTAVGFGIPEHTEQVNALLPMISEKFIQNRGNWLFLGQCLHNMFGEEGKDHWLKVTPEIFMDKVDDEFYKLRESRHGLSALRLIAKQCNKEAFTEWSHQVVLKACLGALQPTAGMTEIADIAKFLFGDTFLCTDADYKSWWSFEGHCWKKLSGGSKMKQKFSRELSVLFETVLQTLTMNDLPPEAKDIIKEMREKCIQTIRGLKNPSFKSNLLNEASEVCMNPEFTDLADEDYMLLGLKNGVFDFTTMTHRRGYPEDFITLQMGVPYLDHFTWDHPEVKEVMSFFRKVLYHDDLINFALKHKSTCCVGGNLDKLCMILIGETAHNGKTTTQKLDKHTFGTYCGKLPLGAVVGRTPDGGAADPANARTKGQRMVWIDEANQTQNFNFSFLKTVTGNDEIWARPLYSQGFIFTPQYKLFMPLNVPPGAKTSDSGVWERMALLPHESRFVVNPPADEDEQWRSRTFRADPFIENRLKELAPAYFWILTQYWVKYKQEGLTKPEAVVLKSQKYKYDNDLFMQFVDNKVEKTERHLDFISLNDIYINFKQWHVDAYPKSHIPDKNQFEKEITRIMGPPKQDPETRWHGIKIKSAIQGFAR